MNLLGISKINYHGVMLCTHDIILIDYIRKMTSSKVERWSEGLEYREIRISKRKIEYINCNYRKNEKKNERIVVKN